MSRLFALFIFCLFIGEITTCLSQSLPIKPSRTISFTTNEGTNMDVDISPDGHTILFDLLGDLYTVPSVGGDATQLTRGLAINLRPIWSPNGKKIAYISDTSGAFHLNVRDITGTFHSVLEKSDEQLNYKQNPIWTPEGNYIVVGDSVYGLIGGKISLQTNIRNRIGFSLDGKFEYYLDSGKIYRNEHSQNTRTAISPVLKRFYSGALSPDAHWWTYVTDSNSNLCLITKDLTNNTERILVTSLFVKSPIYRPFPQLHFSFSLDSKSLFIGYGGKIHRIYIETGVDQVIPFTAKVKSDLGPFDYNTFRVSQDSLKVRYTRSANASPDGKHLVFSALDRLYVMDLPHGAAHKLINQSISQFQPAWSPDGKWIAYVSWCDTVGGYLWRVPASGGLPEQLTQIPGHYQRPAWSPDGTFIAVIMGTPKLGDRDEVGRGQLQLIPVNGGTIRAIDDTVPLWNQLAFSPDGNRVIYEPEQKYVRPGTLSPQLVSKDLDGKNFQVIAIGWSMSSHAFIRQRVISADGRFIVYSMGEDLYLLPLCKLTDPIVIYDSKQQFSAIKFAKGVDPYWEKGGKILCWTYANKFYRVDPDKISAQAQKKLTMGYSDNDITITPDQVISMDITVPALHAHGMLALRDVRIITMQGNKVIEHGTILIKDGRFAAVGPTALIHIPKDARIMDLPGTTVMPGFVDMHLHMRIPPDVFPQQSWMFLVNLAFGVTTARDPSLSFDSFGYKELLESGEMIGPRLYSVGRAVRLFSEGIVKVDNIDDARAIVKKRAAFGGTVIKQYVLPTRLQKQLLLMASREAGLNMTNEGDYDPLVQLGMLKDGSTGIEHNPNWGDIYNDMISFIAQSGTYFTPTLQVRFGEELTRGYSNYMYWHQPDPKLIRFSPDEDLKEIIKAGPLNPTHLGLNYPSFIVGQIRRQGGRVMLGSHGNNEGIGVHNELWALQSGGLSNLEALQAATIVGAEGLGVQKDLGSIETGKIADLLILNKNPLDDIHNSREIRFVMKDGILYDGNTLNTIWPMTKVCPEWRLK